MYHPLRIALKFIQYYITASNGKGHGIHSPFVFDFVTRVLNDQTTYADYSRIEALRSQLIKDERALQIRDWGAGSSRLKSSERTVRQIARTSLKSAKYAQLLYRMVQYYQPATTVEIGTSLGITSSYLAAANPEGSLYTMEGSDAVADIARKHFEFLELKNVRLVRGRFEEQLESTLNQLDHVDFAFIDGNHRREAVLDYFRLLMNKSAPGTIVVVDDIHWSKEMEEAWREIREQEPVRLSIDLFFMGIIFMKTEFKVKQNFSIRY